jgi:UDP-glucose 4-epimerase
MRILVTGAQGFIGRHVVGRLAGSHELFALGRRASDRKTPGVTWLQHDLTQPLEGADLPTEVDAVIHLAQSRHYKEFPERSADIFAVNTEGTFQLLEYARAAGAQSFIFTSTGGVYSSSHEPVVETDPVTPIDFYLTSKYAAELLIANYESFFRTVVMRMFFVYGPGQEGMLVPRLLDRVRAGGHVTLEGKDGIRINPIYVGDVVDVFEPALMLERSALINIAGDEVVTLGELVRLMGSLLAREPVIERVVGGQGGGLVGDNRRMKEILGVSPRTTLAQGLAAMVKSYSRA